MEDNKMSNNKETETKKVKVVVISPFTDKENDYLLRTPKLNNEYETTEERAKELIEKGKVKLAKAEPEFKLNKKSLTVKVGDTEKLEVIAAEATAVTWASSDAETVSVDEDGNVTALKDGKADITVTTEDGKTATCKVTVKEA